MPSLTTFDPLCGKGGLFPDGRFELFCFNLYCVFLSSNTPVSVVHISGACRDFPSDAKLGG